jgi:hypothetical protein
MPTRRSRLRAIRARLAELLEFDELERLAAGREPYKPRPEVTATNLARYVATTLGDAALVEPAGPEWRGTKAWRHRAEYVAEKLEGLAAWLDEDDLT